MAYDLIQTTYLFSWASNAASNVQGTSQELADFLTKSLTTGGTWSSKVYNTKTSYTLNGMLSKIGGSLAGKDWDLAKGINPGCLVPSTSGTGRAQNSAVVVYSPSLDTYICAIAGTNPSSPYDWTQEDMRVGPDSMLNFPLNTSVAPKADKLDPSISQVSHGTALGIYNLLNRLVDSNNAKVDIAGFLGSIQRGANTKIIFAGHSLGGALSPTLAYQMQQTVLKSWPAGSIMVLPTAGPSAGNQQFADGWSSTFAPIQISNGAAANTAKQFNVGYWNYYDLVPHAWTAIFNQNGTPTSGPYFFNHVPTKVTQAGSMQSIIVPLQDQPLKGNMIAGEVYDLVNPAQNNGNNAKMGNFKNRQCYHPNPSPAIVYWDASSNAYATYNIPVAPATITDRQTLERMLLMTHVWQYFQIFGIDPTAVPRPIASSTGVAGAEQELAPA